MPKGTAAQPRRFLTGLGDGAVNHDADPMANDVAQE